MRDAAISLAVEHLRAGGYRNLSFGEIAVALGTTRANLHHHFQNKEGLGIEAIQAYLAAEKASMEQIIGENDGDIRALLHALEQHLIELVSTSSAANPCVMSQILNDVDAPESMRQLVLARCDEEQRSIQRQFAASRSKGPVPKKRSDEDLAYTVMATMFGIMQMGFMNKSAAGIQKHVSGSLTGILT